MASKADSSWSWGGHGGMAFERNNEDLGRPSSMSSDTQALNEMASSILSSTTRSGINRPASAVARAAMSKLGGTGQGDVALPPAELAARAQQAGAQKQAMAQHQAQAQ